MTKTNSNDTGADGVDGVRRNDDCAGAELTTAFVPFSDSLDALGPELVAQSTHSRTPVAQSMLRCEDDVVETVDGDQRCTASRAAQTAAPEATHGLFGSSGKSVDFEQTPKDEDESDDGVDLLFVNEDECCCGCCIPSSSTEASCCYCDNNAQLFGLEICLAPCHTAHCCDFFLAMCTCCCNDVGGPMCLEGCCNECCHCCCGALCAS